MVVRHVNRKGQTCDRRRGFGIADYVAEDAILAEIRSEGNS
jgi:hypothetical protein